MKKNVFVIFFCLSCLFSQAQTYWARVKESGQWIYIDTLGQKQVACPYLQCKDFSEGKALVKHNDAWGFMDKKGKVAKGFIYRPGIDPYKEGYAAYKGYFLDHDEKEVFKEKLFEYVHNFSEGFSLVRVKGLWGAINKKGDIVIKPQYDDMGDFHEGVSAAGKRDRWVYLDTTGKAVLTFRERINFCRNFSDGVALVRYNDHDGWGAINKKGKVLVLGGRYKMDPFHEGFTCMYDSRRTPHVLRMVDSTNTEFIKMTYTGLFGQATRFSEGLVDVGKGGKIGYMNKQKEWVIEPKFETGKSFSYGLARVMVNGLWGYINKKGEMVIPAKFQAAEDFHKVD